jgi:hypothetical protein
MFFNFPPCGSSIIAATPGGKVATPIGWAMPDRYKDEHGHASNLPNTIWDIARAEEAVPMLLGRL